MRNFLGLGSPDTLQEPKLSLWDRAKGIACNIGYWSKPNASLSSASSIFACGKQVSSSECQKVMQDIIYFSYRSGMECMGRHSSDEGWGCMMRVGQMAFGRFLKIFKQTHNEQLGRNQDERIIHQFHDNDPHSIYSATNILSGPESVLNSTREGKWLTVPQIANTLASLHRKKQPLGYEDLSILVQDSGIVFSQLAQAMGFQLCENHSSIECNTCGNTRNRRLRHVGVVVVCGLHERRNILLRLMECEQFVGMLGGVPGRAFFFYGYKREEGCEQLLYLDPHQVKSNKELTLQDYYCKKLLSVKLQSVTASAGICFYLSSPSSIAKFQEELIQIENQYKHEESMPFGIVLKSQRREGVKEAKEIDDTHCEISAPEKPTDISSFRQLEFSKAYQDPSLSSFDFEQVGKQP